MSRHVQGGRRQKRRPHEADEDLPVHAQQQLCEPQVRVIKSALSNVPLDSVGAIRGGLGRSIKTGQIKSVPLEKCACVNAQRITAYRARAIKKRLKKDEYFVYDKGAIPAERGGVRLPTCADQK